MTSNTRFEDVIEDLAPYVGENGVCKDDVDRIMTETNRARRLLWNRGDWNGIIEYGCVVLDGCWLTLPWRIEKIRNMWVGKYPIQVRNQWYEGLSFSGIQPCCGDCCSGCLVHTGDKIPFARQFVANNKLRFSPMGQMDEVTLELTLRDHGGFIYEEEVTISDRPVENTSTPHDVLAVHKPVTGSQIKVECLNPSSKTAKWLAYWAKEQEDPEFNLYKYTGPQCEQLMIKGKLRYWPIRDEKDYLGIDNVVALQSAMQANVARKNGNIEGMSTFLSVAEENLEEDIEDETGNQFEPIDLIIEGAVPNILPTNYGVI